MDWGLAYIHELPMRGGSISSCILCSLVQHDRPSEGLQIGLINVRSRVQERFGGFFERAADETQLGESVSAARTKSISRRVDRLAESLDDVKPDVTW